MEILQPGLPPFQPEFPIDIWEKLVASLVASDAAHVGGFLVYQSKGEAGETSAFKNPKATGARASA